MRLLFLSQERRFLRVLAVDLDEPGDMALMQVVAEYLYSVDESYAEVRRTAESFGKEV